MTLVVQGKHGVCHWSGGRGLRPICGARWPSRASSGWCWSTRPAAIWDRDADRAPDCRQRPARWPLVTAYRPVRSCSWAGRRAVFQTHSGRWQTYLGIHGPHKKDTKKVDPRQAGQIMLFKQQIGRAFQCRPHQHGLVRHRGRWLADARTLDPVRQPQRVSYHCRSAQSLRKDCTEFKDQRRARRARVSAATAALTPVTIPDQWREMPQVFGRELTQAITDADGFASGLAARQCSTDSCRKLVTDWQNAKEHRAIAVPCKAQGWVRPATVTSWSRLSWLRRTACNHVRDRPARLCEAQAVDGFDARELYARDGPAPAGRSGGVDLADGALLRQRGIRRRPDQRQGPADAENDRHHPRKASMASRCSLPRRWSWPSKALCRRP